MSLAFCYLFSRHYFQVSFNFKAILSMVKKKSKYRDGEPLKGFIAKTKQVYSIELHIARKRDKLTYDLKKWKKLISVVAN